MGADLYLPDVLHDCHERYGQAAALLEQLAGLVAGESGPQMGKAGRQLKEALVLHAHQSGEMAPALFDQVAEAADLAQGELAVSTRALAGHAAALVQEVCAHAPAVEEGLGSPGLLALTADLLALLSAGPDETIIRRGAAMLARHLLARRETATLADAGRLIGEVLVGHPYGVLSLLVEHRLLPALEHVRGAQADCLLHLEAALTPLAPDPSTPSAEVTEVPAARALLQFHQLASALSETITRLHQQLTATRQEPFSQGETLPVYLLDARTQLEKLWHEEERLHTQARAIETLRPLFLRTLPPHPDPGTSQEEVQASPLQRAFGCLMEHHRLWPALLQMVTRELESARTILAGDSRAALAELCSVLVLLLAPEQAPHEGFPFQGPQVPLSPGVRMVGTDLMGYCYLQTMGVVQQARRDAHLRSWVENELSEKPLTSTTSGLILRFWRLLQGDSSLWTEVLAAQLRDALRQQAPDPTYDRLDTLLEELQGLLEERPHARLTDLLTRVQARVPADSPLVHAANRLRSFVQGDLTEALAESLAQLEQEVGTCQDWPEDRRRDALWLLTLVRTLWQTPAGQHGLLLYALLHAVSEESGTAAWLRARLDRNWPGDEPGRRQFLRDLRADLQKALPEEGPQPLYPDLRTRQDWKVRLLRTLLQTHLACTESENCEPGEQVRALLLLPPVLQVLQRLLFAWRFPPQGYFRDPYNDAVRRGGAYEIAGSSGRGRGQENHL